MKLEFPSALCQEMVSYLFLRLKRMNSMCLSLISIPPVFSQELEEGNLTKIALLRFMTYLVTSFFSYYILSSLRKYHTDVIELRWILKCS